MKPWRARAALFAVVLLAFALRVANLDVQSIWGDEAFSIFTAKQTIAFVLSGGADTHPPLYHFLLHTWMLIVGVTPFALRYVSVFWGVVTVAAGARILNFRFQISDFRLENRANSPLATRHSPLATLAALLLALCPFLIYYAQETRMYAQAAALCTLSLLFLVRRQATGKGLAGWFITTLLAIYSHYFAFFVLMAEDLYMLWGWWTGRRQTADSRRTTVDGRRSTMDMARQLRTMLTAQALMAMLYLPWVIEQYGYLTHQANARLSTLSVQGIWDVISKSLGALFVGTILDGAPQVIAALLCLALATIGIIASREATNKFVAIEPVVTSSFVTGSRAEAGVRPNAPTNSSSAVVLLALVILVPILGAVAVNPLLPFFRERFLLIASPAFIILMTLGIGYLSQWRVRNFPLFRLISFISLFLFSTLALGNYWYNPAYHKGEYDLAIAEIRAAAQPGDAVLVYSPMQDAVYDYYRIAGLNSFTLPKANLDEVRATHPRAWLLLYGDPASYDPAHAAEQYLSAHGFKAFYQSYRDGALARYDFTSAGVQVENKRIRFGDTITLSGYGLPGTIARGSTLGVALQWQTSAPLSDNYTVFVHLLGPDGKVAAQMDTQPAGGTRPTRLWQIGEVIRDNVGVAITAGIAPGRYQVEVGLYELQSLKRLPVANTDGLAVNGDAVVIGVVDVR